MPLLCYTHVQNILYYNKLLYIYIRRKTTKITLKVAQIYIFIFVKYSSVIFLNCFRTRLNWSNI